MVTALCRLCVVAASLSVLVVVSEECVGIKNGEVGGDIICCGGQSAGAVGGGGVMFVGG